MKKRLIPTIILMPIAVVIIGAISLLLFARADVPFVNLPKAPIPEYASSYSIVKAVCMKSVQDCDTIEFTFNASRESKNSVPSYDIKEFPDEAKMEIIFHNISAVNTEFEYKKMISSSAIDELAYEQIDKDLIVNIYRKGVYLPANVILDKNTAKIYLPKANYADNFIFSNEEPPNNSIVYPAKQAISIEVALKEPLKKALVYLQGSLADFKTIDIGPNKYSLNFTTVLENDQQYKIRVIITDAKDRIAANVWEFGAQKKVKTGQLDKDRFKYLGWWGNINTKNADIYEEPSTQSKKSGSFSTINRVKVLEEIQGESIKRNNIWYKIDGGAYPGKYIHSAYVTPIEQPQPPANAKIPAGIGKDEYWIDVDLTKKVLTIFQYDKPVFATYVATGRPGNPTLTGTYRIWYKLKKTRMKGGPPTVPYVYDLPNVPYVMYYRGSYAVHGTYWHDKFGSRQSAGCTNLTQGDAKFIFDLTGPKLPENLNAVRPSIDDPGTVVYNHY